MIKLIIFDIDGIITDDTVIIDEEGHEQKRLNFKDVDGIFELHRRGFELAAITGESSAMVDYFKNRFPWKYFYAANKSKKATIQEIEKKSGYSFSEICFIGEGKYDVEALEYVGLGICPSDSIEEAKRVSDIILQNKGGQGCVWELIGILKNINAKNTSQNYFYNRIEEHTNIFKSMSSNQKLIDTVMRVGDEITKSFQNGGQLLLCGNGGSAADAQHIAAEFVSRFYKERQAMNAEALTVNTSTLTAIGNDYSYERIFLRQIEAKGKKGDILVGISTSAKSKNVLQALRYARKCGILTILLTGDYGDVIMEDVAEYVICVPSKITPRIQEAHIFIGHLWAEYVEYRMIQEREVV